MNFNSNKLKIVYLCYKNLKIKAMQENDENKLDKYSEDRYEEGVAKLLEEKQLKIKWRKEIEENESIQNYFKGYIPDSIDIFLKMYLTKKYLAHIHADFYEKQLEKKRTKWIDLANEHLEYILQKKLFDLQCLWRAEQIKIEAVSICLDFEVWGKDIFNCLFLEPINPDDIKNYQDFLNSGQANRYSYHTHWQDYESLKEEYISGGEDSSIPEWYEYHNVRTGNSSLFLLPDTRGRKEEFYTDLVNAELREEYKKKQLENPMVFDDRPFLSYGDDQVLDFFSKTFETAEENKKFKNYQEYNAKNQSDDIRMEELMWTMADVDEYISIESHYDYKQALELAYNKYYFGKIAEHLPIAYQNYIFNKNMSLTIKKDDEDNFYIRLREDYLQKILKGREMNGEPRNFDF